MEPKYWGSSFWNMINAIALSYPEEPDIQDQNNVTAFLSCLQNVLPCEKCRLHFKENLVKFPLTEALTSRDNFIKWVINVHNAVNKSNGLPVLSYEDGINEMKRGLYGSKKISSKYYVIGGLIVGIGAFWYLRKTKFFKKL